jgi:tetratricopeptide (TPR) repeat protein
MKKPADSPINGGLGREICLRDGGIRALLTGRVEKLDMTYMLGVVLVDPNHGAAVAALSEEAEGQKAVLSALRRLSNRVRQVLGEELAAIRENEQKLERVTTPSLQALQFYSRADALIYQGKSDRAEPLLKQAIAEDPAFASAYVLLAWAVHNQDRHEDEYRVYARRALELSETATVRERYFIEGSYHQLMGQSEKAAAAYQALLDVYPGHYWATSNLAGTYLRLDRKAEAAPYMVRRADMRPHSLAANMRAVEALADWRKDLAAAAPYMRRAEELAALPEVQDRFPLMAAKAHFLTAAELWQRGEFGDLVSELDRLSSVAEAVEGEAGTWFLGLLGQSYLSQGRFKQAQEVFENIPDPDWRRVELALLALAEDNRETLRRHARQLENVWIGSSLPPLFMARAGLLVEAQRAIDARRDEYNSPRLMGFVQLMQGDLVLAEGRAEEATRIIQAGLEASRPWDTITHFLVSDALATAWEMQGNRQRAIRVLEEAVVQGDRISLFPRSSVLWLQTRARLARLYRELGRQREAQEIESTLSKFLAHADPDHPLLRQLKRSRDVAVAESPK